MVSLTTLNIEGCEVGRVLNAVLEARGHGIDSVLIITSWDADPDVRRPRSVGYGIRDTMVRTQREVVEEIAPVTLEGVNTRVTELTAVQEQDTLDIYAVIEDAQD
ncbi:hypothetical protein Tco_0540375 [Tanacetum coccineum]